MDDYLGKNSPCTCNFCYVNCSHSFLSVSHVIWNHLYVATWVISFILRSILLTTKIVAFSFMALCSVAAGYLYVGADQLIQGNLLLPWEQQQPTKPHSALAHKTSILTVTTIKTQNFIHFFRNFALSAVYLLGFPCFCTSTEAIVFHVSLWFI
jgi:hypothetical protein